MIHCGYFEENMDKLITIACDGACSGNGNADSPGGWGAVLTYQGHRKELCGGMAVTTNNQMELTAMVEALLSIKNTSYPVRVFSDSAYVTNGINQKWYVNWEKNNWHNSNKQPVKNKELWAQLISLYRRFDRIEFVKVKGHLDRADDETMAIWHKKNAPFLSLNEYKKGIELNIVADQLANQGMAPFL